MENRQAVKVVLIDTRYVKTDATSFKSVVQSLTGKDSSVAWIHNKAGDFAGASKRKRDSGAMKSDVNVLNGKDQCSVLSKVLSFKDFEMPSLEELQCWLSDDYISSF